jgi:hypothetical protein
VLTVSAQMSDLSLHRHILVQALIMLDFLLSVTEKGKQRTIDLKGQKSLIYPFTLSDEDVSLLLRSTPDHVLTGCRLNGRCARKQQSMNF